jgi:hypothetical protein
MIISKVVKFICVVLVWYMYFSLAIQALATHNILSLIVSMLWSFAALMVFPVFKGGGI